MANFVLVHGAWHWGGCYQKLAAELLARGHNVAMPDLATHGFDATPVGTVTDMAQYTAPARRMIETSAEPVILVGHSMGGATCTYLGEQMAETIKTLVYLTAFMVPNGVCPNEVIMSPDYINNAKAAELFALLAPTDLGIELDMTKPNTAKAAFYADCSDHDIGIATKNILTVQPFTPFITPSDTTAARFGALRRIYVECSEDKAIPIEMQRAMQGMVPGAEVVSMETSHSPFFSQPVKLAECLSALA